MKDISKHVKLYYAFHIIAMLTMMIDHIAVLETNGTGNLYVALRLIGRIAAPLYGYFIFNSFRYTHNRFTFATRLLVMAVVSEFAFDSMHYNMITSWVNAFEKQNVIFTFFLAFCMLSIIDLYNKSSESKTAVKGLVDTLIVVAATAIGFFIKSDYAVSMIPFIAGLYGMKEYSMKSHRMPAYWVPGFYFIAANCINSMLTVSKVNIAWTYAACLLSIVLIVVYSAYEDEKFEVSPVFTKINRWFYPVHLYLLQAHMIATYILFLLSLFKFRDYTFMG